MKKLISLEEHNRIATQINETGGNGIACPNCDEELYDYPDNTVLTSNPPQYHIFCKCCYYRGMRY